MLKPLIKGRVAVFVDAANLSHSEDKLKWKISYRKLKSYLEKECGACSIHFFTAIDSRNDGQMSFIKKLKSDLEYHVDELSS
jgi:uncharacterized LabA/DUF88 family protein